MEVGKASAGGKTAGCHAFLSCDKHLDEEPFHLRNSFRCFSQHIKQVPRKKAACEENIEELDFCFSYHGGLLLQDAERDLYFIEHL
jgi:hypothetical protein